MADIFISYAKQDRAKIEPLAKALAKQGWSVWWDRQIPAGRTWREVIGEALEAARAVIVAWSATSVKSRWVQEEADWGLERKLLVPIFLDDVRPPLGFGTVQAVDLSEWNPSESFSRLDKLLVDLELILGPSPLKTKTAEQIRAQLVVDDEAKRREKQLRLAEEEAKREQFKEKQRIETRPVAKEELNRKQQKANQIARKRTCHEAKWGCGLGYWCWRLSSLLRVSGSMNTLKKKNW